jgi:hypothetical protein
VAVNVGQVVRVPVNDVHAYGDTHPFPFVTQPVKKFSHSVSVVDVVL